MNKSWRYSIEYDPRYGWGLEIIDMDSEDSHPKIYKQTPSEIVSRLMQMLDIKGPLHPQDYAERICIGETEAVEHE